MPAPQYQPLKYRINTYESVLQIVEMVYVYAGLKKACMQGAAVLQGSGSVVSATTAAIMVLEVNTIP